MKKRVLFFRIARSMCSAISVPCSYARSKPATEVFERIQNSVQFPGDTVIINVEGQKSRLRRKFGQMRWAKILNQGSSVILRPLMLVGEKILATVAILLGIFLLLLVLDILHFVPEFEAAEPEPLATIGFVLLSIAMIIAGTWWFIDSTE